MKKKAWQKRQEHKLKVILRLLLVKAYTSAKDDYGIGEDQCYCDLFKISASGRITRWYIRGGKVVDQEKWEKIIIAYYRPLIQKLAERGG